MNPLGLLADKARVEQGLAAPEALRADRDDLAVGQLVLLLQVLGGLGVRELGLEVLGAVGAFEGWGVPYAAGPGLLGFGLHKGKRTASP